jgi:cell division protein FtsL
MLMLLFLMVTVYVTQYNSEGEVTGTRIHISRQLAKQTVAANQIKTTFMK